MRSDRLDLYMWLAPQRSRYRSVNAYIVLSVYCPTLGVIHWSRSIQCPLLRIWHHTFELASKLMPSRSNSLLYNLAESDVGKHLLLQNGMACLGVLQTHSALTQATISGHSRNPSTRLVTSCDGGSCHTRSPLGNIVAGLVSRDLR